MNLHVCDDCEVVVPAETDSLTLVFLLDQHALCPRNWARLADIHLEAA